MFYSKFSAWPELTLARFINQLNETHLKRALIHIWRLLSISTSTAPPQILLIHTITLVKVSWPRQRSELQLQRIWLLLMTFCRNWGSAHTNRGDPRAPLPALILTQTPSSCSQAAFQVFPVIYFSALSYIQEYVQWLKCHNFRTFGKTFR